MLHVSISVEILPFPSADHSSRAASLKVRSLQSSLLCGGLVLMSAESFAGAAGGWRVCGFFCWVSVNSVLGVVSQ